MTPSQKSKSQAEMTLANVSKISGVSPQTLSNWHKNKPKLFAVVLAGCKAESVKKEMHSSDQ